MPFVSLLHDCKAVRPTCHFERGCVQVWGYRYLSSIEALSREISHRHAACPTGAGDFSTLVEMTTGRGALVTFMGLFYSGVRFLHSASLRSK